MIFSRKVNQFFEHGFWLLYSTVLLSCTLWRPNLMLFDSLYCNDLASRHNPGVAEGKKNHKIYKIHKDM